MFFLTRNAFIFVWILFLLFQFCSTRMVSKDKISEFNEIFLNRVYVLKEDISHSPQETLKKGTRVRVYIESTPTLLKVKCFPVEEPREIAIGRMAIYKINDKLDRKQLNMDDLERIISELFEIYKQPVGNKREKG